ncbi:hypothetical protein [Bradyrhizobium nanningense]|uniref:hypothetical protein n=1 Tax=Bradyrhizobium nanningense TaxID=1325118 RepID=UPI001008BB0C|nr:hypothetical protein [Bradyrhizobium nanningense]
MNEQTLRPSMILGRPTLQWLNVHFTGDVGFPNGSTMTSHPRTLSTGHMMTLSGEDGREAVGAARAIDELKKTTSVRKMRTDGPHSNVLVLEG